MLHCLEESGSSFVGLAPVATVQVPGSSSRLAADSSMPRVEHTEWQHQTAAVAARQLGVDLRFLAAAFLRPS